MPVADSPLGRLQKAIAAHRWTVIVGLGVFIGAVGVGVIMGGPLLLGLVGMGAVLVALMLLAWRSRRTSAAVSGGAVVSYFALATALTLAVIQLVPYGRNHSNPPTIGEPAWASPQTRELMVNACFGCHSNEVEWPWYSNIAPISWVVTLHVDEGRDEVNYSEFTVDPGEAEETIETIRDGEMPPSYYTVFGLHPEANLSDQEIADLIAGLQLTPGMNEDD